jgi:lytic murein transglycosylase
MQTAVLAGLVAAVLIGTSTPLFAASCGNGPAGFEAWLQGFKQQAAAQGISPGVIAAALDGLTYDPAVIAKDRGQSVFTQSFLQFSDRMVNGNRLQIGSGLLKKNADTFAKIQQKYGVPGPVLVGFWGLETDFGKVMGNMQTLRSLATLAFDCRRPDEFKAQLLDALRVIQRGDLSPPEMHGPWAGEMGQFQFVPTVYYKYAVDFDGSGKRDLITNTPDALASAANYLNGLGWKAGQPWLEEVRVPADMDWSQAELTIKKPRAYWAKSGVTYPGGKALPADNVPTALLLPMGRNGPAFLEGPEIGLDGLERRAGLFMPVDERESRRRRDSCRSSDRSCRNARSRSAPGSGASARVPPFSRCAPLPGDGSWSERGSHGRSRRANSLPATQGPAPARHHRCRQGSPPLSWS